MIEKKGFISCDCISTFLKIREALIWWVAELYVFTALSAVSVNFNGLLRKEWKDRDHGRDELGHILINLSNELPNMDKLSLLAETTLPFWSWPPLPEDPLMTPPSQLMPDNECSFFSRPTCTPPSRFEMFSNTHIPAASRWTCLAHGGMFVYKEMQGLGWITCCQIGISTTFF